MSGVTEALTRKVGPMPLGVWLAAVAGGLAISWQSRRGAGDAAPTAAQYLAANTDENGEIQTPDLADVIFTPIFQLPEQAPPSVTIVVPAPTILPGATIPAPAAPGGAPKPAPKPKPAPSKGGGGYTVRSGDTLWEIARDRMGSGARWSKLYAANAAAIERAAKAHGRSSSRGYSGLGHWIYPGTVLVIP